MKLPQPQSAIVEKIDAYHEAHREDPRPHLGCSQLGHPCSRWLWLSFRWAVVEKHAGRLLRLFRRGQREEETINADLRAAGLVLREGAQLRVDFGAHVSGSVDAIIESGVPEAPKKAHVGEYKTHSLKSFSDLAEKGVEKSKPMHWAQMQCYMHGASIDRAVYVAVCKDDDRIYTERIRYDKVAADQLITRGHCATLGESLPPPISTDPSWYQCKMCPAHTFCHETHLTTEVNCRTCAHATPLPNSTWRCERWEADNIPVEWQRKGCDDHVMHPDLVPWQRRETRDGITAVWMIDGVAVRNGAPAFDNGEKTFGSKEIVADPAECAKSALDKLVPF